MTPDVACSRGDVVQFGICICTRNRPDELRVALQSIRESSYPASQVVVSDDSTDTRSRDSVSPDFPEVIFTAGPRKGLGANRNNALRFISTTHVLFIDDDVQLAPDFLAKIATALSSCQNVSKVIITGTEITHGERVYPHKPSFLGFQSIDYRAGEELCSIVINATVFPCSLFENVQFDENLVYGSDEVDISAQAVYRSGYRIYLEEHASNFHFPSRVNRDYYSPHFDASRIFVMFKKYRSLQKKPVKALIFLVLAYSHSLLANLKRSGLRGLARFSATVTKSFTYIRRFRCQNY